jgi:hypothetical protein
MLIMAASIGAWPSQAGVTNGSRETGRGARDPPTWFGSLPGTWQHSLRRVHIRVVGAVSQPKPESADERMLHVRIFMRWPERSCVIVMSMVFR